MKPEIIKERLEAILPTVARPGRYLGLERNLVRKPWDSVGVRLLLAFPDEYSIGMSHLGTRILYHLANSRSDTLAERAFAPWPDMAAAMRTAGVPLYSLESYHAARDFDIMGITLQSELNYSNLPYLLDLAAVPRFSGGRGEEHPLVVAGGPCTANPEPMADFFDVMAIGDGEILLAELLDLVKAARLGGWTRKRLLRAAAARPGLYVPSLYSWVPGRTTANGGIFEKLDDDVPEKVTRVFVSSLGTHDLPERPIVPALDTVQDRLGIEIMRGCTRGCRFCQAGYWYRPVRERDPATVLETLERHVQATGHEEVGLLSLSSADYSQITPLARHLADRLASRRVGVALPSLRAESFSVELADSVSRVRRSSFTFAPETGSDRLRRVINKSFSNATLVEAAEAAFARGWGLIKLYAMIGLPGETDEDLGELVTLTREVLAAARRAGNRRAEVKVSVGAFVPKSWTAFQWEPFLPMAELERRIDLLRQGFRGLRGAKLSWGEPRQARLEALLARGDRRMAAVIARAHDLGAVLDGWTECLRLDAWEQALGESELDVDSELGPRDLSASLPWEVVDPGVRREFLAAERRRALLGIETGDCRWDRCTRCGIPGNGEETQLATDSLASLQPPPPTVPEPPAASGREPVKWRFTFTKLGDVRWLSHRNVMSLLERALRAAQVPVQYTQGYNPHIRLSMGPALPVGYEAGADLFDVACVDEVSKEMLARANAVLPEGLVLTAAVPQPQGTSSLGKQVTAASYRISLPAGLAWPRESIPDLTTDHVRSATLDGEDLLLTVSLEGDSGSSLKALLATLGFAEDSLLGLRVRRETLHLADRNHSVD